MRFIVHRDWRGFCGNDAFHIAKPDSDGQVRVIEAALVDAGLLPETIDYINAHGTATVTGDAAEAAAISAVFGRRSRSVPVSSTKALHGHLIGAAGALELVATILSTQHGVIPSTANVLRAAPKVDRGQNLRAATRPVFLGSPHLQGLFLAA